MSSAYQHTASRFIQGILTLGFACASSSISAHATNPPITDIAFSPDASSIVAVSQAGVQEFSWPNLQVLRTIDVDAANLHDIAFSPDGKQLAVAGGHPSEDGIVEILNWPDCQTSSKFEDHTDSARCVCWIGNSAIVSAGVDRRVVHRNLLDGSTNAYAGHSRSVSDIAILPNSRTLVSTGDDHSVRVWDVETAKQIHNLNQHTRPVHVAALRKSTEKFPLVATAAADRTIRFWQPTIGRMIRYIRLPSQPLDIAWMGEGPLLAATDADGKLHLIDCKQVKILRTEPAIDGWAYSVAAHPTDGSVAVGGSNGQLRRIVFDAPTR